MGLPRFASDRGPLYVAASSRGPDRTRADHEAPIMRPNLSMNRWFLWASLCQ